MPPEELRQIRQHAAGWHAAISNKQSGEPEKLAILIFCDNFPHRFHNHSTVAPNVFHNLDRVFHRGKRQDRVFLFGWGFLPHSAGRLPSSRFSLSYVTKSGLKR
jgi:hypothetical protein